MPLQLQVVDISHESLIKNLNKMSSKVFKRKRVVLDTHKPLDRLENRHKCLDIAKRIWCWKINHI